MPYGEKEKRVKIMDIRRHDGARLKMNVKMNVKIKTIKYKNQATIQVTDDGRIFQNGEELEKRLLSKHKNRAVVDACPDEPGKPVMVNVARAVCFAFNANGMSWQDVEKLQVDHIDC